MAYSRTSVPLIAAFLLALAVYIVYLILTRNIFNLDIVNKSSSYPPSLQTTANEADMPNAVVDFNDQPSGSGSKILKKIFTPDAQKISKTDQADRNISTIEKNQSINKRESTEHYPAAGAVEFPQNPQVTPAYELKFLWDKYSARIPRLYSRSLGAETEEILSRVGEISMSLDLLYPQDRSRWMLHLEQAREELIAIAVKGEREGARALSFQYFRSPLNKITDSLAWAMIANAIAPNDYYLTICTNNPAPCSEEVFAQATEQANSDVVNYGFSVRKKL